MKKLFTFVFCAFCAVSVWGTEVAIGSGNQTSTKYPLYSQFKYGLTQFIYLSNEIGSVTENAISKISFNAASGNYSRTISVYIENTSAKDLSSAWIPVSSSPVFIGSVDISGGWYDITLTSKFIWDKSCNILITICDNTNSTESMKNHYVYEANARGRASGDSSAKDPTNPSGGYGAESVVPQIKMTFVNASPTPTGPTLNATGTTDIGVIDPAFETKDVVLTITGENLDEDVTIACAEGLSCTNNQIAKETVMATGAKVTISTTNDFNVEGTKVTFTSGTASKEVTIIGTAASYHSPTNGATFFNYSNASVSPYFGYVYYNASNLTISDVANSHFKPYSTADFMVDYSGIDIDCAGGGKVTNLKGKFTSETVFKAFSFDYEAPELSAIVINENEDNSTDWPEVAQSGKELLITRTIVPNEWNSIVLPTYLTSTEVGNIFGDGTDVEEFTNAVVTSSNIELNFTKKTSGIEAGVPYLIKPTQAIDNPLNLTNHSFTKTVTPVDHDGIRFEGVLVPTLIDGGDGSDYIIVGANNTLLHPMGEGTIKGMRAYFHVVGSAAKAALKTAKVSMNTGSTTELVLVKDNQVKPYKTMVNDQIVIVNEGKQINILGQIIK